jgi:hypothetical protein
MSLSIAWFRLPQMARAWSSFRLTGKLEFIFLIPFSSDHLSIFEIYPQSEIPLLTQIAHLDWPDSEEAVHLLPDSVICHVFYENRIVFRVVDFRTNYSTSFSADVDVKMIGSNLNYNVEVFFILLMTLKLASNYLLGRQSRRRQLLSSYIKKEY